MPVCQSYDARRTPLTTTKPGPPLSEGYRGDDQDEIIQRVFETVARVTVRSDNAGQAGIASLAAVLA